MPLKDESSARKVPAGEKISMDAQSRQIPGVISHLRQASAGNSASGTGWKPLRPSSVLQEERPKQGQSS